ncbi:SAM-dependent methyltransferase [Paraburkholderia bannensis]|uniref:SAM-dependent methyltransferase n=1 Tax=Paraburkholderia bannensis TaxID=765414 RepID=A0A7W9U444_9BURK|nr:MULTISPECIES: methyltransferase domain-containing protein [Paraburkholderia]MBB3260514.1 SAM-dependent methyltransferase [Paraburkholderia sp. WP4_3_2]MBB6105550.1 SAM-dependent methyltransferase [Paraburkholderia bannensis]
MSPSHIHLCIIQPGAHVPALGFLDQVRFFRYQFRRLGAEVTIGKNRLRHDAINFIFGAHTGFDQKLTQRYRCVFVNLEQLGELGAQVSPDYLRLLRAAPVVDYDGRNVSAYGAGACTSIVSFAYAPYLAAEGQQPIEERPLDVLFFGSMNERRLQLLREIEAAGCKVSVLPFGIFGAERDAEIRRAKAVFNCHFYDSARFEQARVFHCLSLGTPVISERTSGTQAPPQFDDSVFWVSADNIRTFFQKEFGASSFAYTARARLAAFCAHDVLDQYAMALESAQQYFAGQFTASTPWRPERVHIGSGKDYMPGWLNLDILPRAEPDVLLDLSVPLTLPKHLDSSLAGPVELRADAVDFIYANNVLEHVADLTQLMGNCLRLLKTGGQMLIEVPYEKARSAWQDPTHVRAFNENSWIYYADWFWYLGWFESRFAIVALEYLDEKLAVTTLEHAHFMRVRLQKVATSAQERTTARAVRPDFGGIPEDVI